MSEGDSKLVTPAANRRPPNAGKGRKKGVPNKSTQSVKQALEAAFQGLGGVNALQAWAQSDPGEFYKLWAKMLPAEVKAELSGDTTLNVVIKRYSE